MDFSKTIQAIAEKEQLNLKAAQSLSGGDINEVFLLETSSGKFALKLNSAARFPDMFCKEANGLNLLRQSNSFKIPMVNAYGEYSTCTYLLLEYIPKGNPSPTFWPIFAKKLALLHQTSQPTFGLSEDNYIGSLPQYNQTTTIEAASFYIEKRLLPQIRLARTNGFSFTQTDKFFKTCEAIIPQEKPALIHGDLWNGNYMISTQSEACLIDPAVAFAPRELDLAMMKLFGGFPPTVFETYHELFPLIPNWKERIELWQLYYVLVHVNLFGGSYYASAKQIMAKYS